MQATNTRLLQIKQTIIFYGLLIFISSGCNTKSDDAKPGEGTITYKVSYPYSNLGVKDAFLPSSMDLFFKNEKATFFTTAGMGTVQLLNLLDYKNKKFTALLIDALRSNYACTLTPEEIKENENNPKYEYEFVDGKKTIAGLECKKAIVKDITNNKKFEVYYYNKIKFYYWNSPFKEFDFLLMEYTHTINNLTMKLEATKVDFAPVDTSFFEVKGNYQWLNQKSFYQYLNHM